MRLWDWSAMQCASDSLLLLRRQRRPFAEYVTDSAPRLESAVRTNTDELCPQARDVHVDHVRSRIEVESPDFLQQLRSRERFAAVTDEVLEKREFLGTQIQL